MNSRSTGFPRQLRRWAGSSHGGIATTFALALPVIFAALGLASDFAMMTKVKGELQAAADAAAMAGAREIPLAKKESAQVVSAAKSFASYALVQDSAASQADLAAASLSVSAEVVEDFSAVKVDISQSWAPFFAHFLESGITPVNVTATARFVGRNNIGVLALSNTGTGVFLDDNARLTGNHCGVFSNSTGAKSLKVDSGSKLKAEIICSSGGALVSSSAVADPAPVTDCPPTADPLASRPAPTVGACDHNDLEIEDVTVAINPGVYCGGLVVAGSANVTFNPGVYVMKDGGLKVTALASVQGEGVGFFITGAEASSIFFSVKTHVSLSAPTDGALAGILFFEDHELPVKLNHRITSDDARKLVGTIYFPVGGLVVDAKEPVADQSAYTAIIAKTVELNMGPNLVLNSDYGMTDVPVPAGITGSSQVVLTD